MAAVLDAQGACRPDRLNPFRDVPHKPDKVLTCTMRVGPRGPLNRIDTGALGNPGGVACSYRRHGRTARLTSWRVGRSPVLLRVLLV